MRRIKISLLWHQNLMGPAPIASPGVLDLGEYQSLFNGARAEQNGPLTAPWPPHEQQAYWERYVGQWRALSSLRPREARRRLVPLRTAMPLELLAEDPATEVWTEGFLHPWGASFLVTVSIEGDWPDLAAAADAVIDVRQQKCFGIRNQPGSLSLDDAATLGLEALAALAKVAHKGPRWEPFSVCTLLTAIGEMNQFDPAVESTQAARFLQAITTFSPTWRLDALRPLEEARVAGISAAPASHLVYGIRRARAIWSPAHFLLPAASRTSTLSCHHRNLVLASMQVEALSRFAEDTAARLAAETALADEHRAQVGWTVRILQEIYEGSRSTYRSGSLKAHLEQNQLLAPINAVREEQGLPKFP